VDEGRWTEIGNLQEFKVLSLPFLVTLFCRSEKYPSYCMRLLDFFLSSGWTTITLKNKRWSLAAAQTQKEISFLFFSLMNEEHMCFLPAQRRWAGTESLVYGVEACLWRFGSSFPWSPSALPRTDTKIRSRRIGLIFLRKEYNRRHRGSNRHERNLLAALASGSAQRGRCYVGSRTKWLNRAAHRMFRMGFAPGTIGTAVLCLAWHQNLRVAQHVE